MITVQKTYIILFLQMYNISLCGHAHFYSFISLITQLDVSKYHKCTSAPTNIGLHSSFQITIFMLGLMLKMKLLDDIKVIFIPV